MAKAIMLINPDKLNVFLLISYGSRINTD